MPKVLSWLSTWVLRECIECSAGDFNLLPLIFNEYLVLGALSLVCASYSNSLYSSPPPLKKATPIATTPSQHLTQSFFARPAEVVALELIGCLLVKRQASVEILWGEIVETEAYCRSEPACHGYRRRSPSNETLFGEAGRFYVCVSYGIHHCVKRAVT